MNGDGMDDLVLSAVFADPLGRDKAGLVALVLGSDSFSPNQVIDLNVFTPAAWLVGGAANDRIGFALECGDLNGDSLDDIVVGAHLTAATAGAEAGRCSVVYGNRVIPPGTTIDFISPSAGNINFLGAHAGDRLGYSLACGDFNGDGIDDLMMGAIYLDPPGGEWAGGVFAVYGSDAFDPHLVWDFAGSDPDLLIYGDEALEQAGMSVSAAELNGDGLDDCLVGAFQHSSDTGGDWCGALYGIYGCMEASAPSDPDPASSAVGVPLEVTLGWTTGAEADTFDLFFGTVNPPPPYQAGLTDSFFDLPATVSGQHYYWRVVASNECSSTSSPVWDFTTCIVPAVPGTPDPANGTSGTALDVMLDWSDSVGEVSYNLYFGPSSSPGLWAGGLAGSDYQLPTLDEGVQYHWRVEAVNGCGTTLSAEWNFTTCVSPGIPVLVFPPDGAVDLATAITIYWNEVPGADSYNVYFGDSSPPPPHTAGLTDPLLQLEDLADGVTFHWQVEAVNSCGAVASEIFSFSTIWTPVQMLATGPGPDEGNPPLVRVFDPEEIPVVVNEWNAYGVEKFGVNVAAGDLGWDRLDELVTGAGPGEVFGPHVRGWNVDGGTAAAIPQVSYFAYGTLKYGVNVACGDVDGDGIDEIVTGAGPGEIFFAHVRGWNYDGVVVSSIPGVSWFAYDDLTHGSRVGCADVDGDLIDEILTCPGPGEENIAQVRGWNFDGLELDPIEAINFPAYDEDVVRGGNVTGGSFRD